MKPKKEYSDYKKFCKNHLQETELVQTWGVGYVGEMMGSGDKRQYNGCLIVTDKRVVFYSKGWISEVFEEVALSKISSVESKKVMGHTALKIHTSGNHLQFKSLVPEEARILQKVINEIKNDSGANTSDQQSTSIFLDLEKLGELREKGILTEDEFTAKKEHILKNIA